LQAWLDETGHGRGYTASTQTMYELSQDWYAGRMEVGWEPPTAEEAEAIFSRHGLAGEFWRLG